MTLKAKVLPGGLEAKPWNPYDKTFKAFYEHEEWKHFDKENPTLPLTQQCTEGLIIECRKVMQEKSQIGDWKICSEGRPGVFLHNKSFKTRWALEPVAPISEKDHIADAGKLVVEQSASVQHDYKLFEQLLKKHGIYEYDVRINAVLAEYLAKWQQSQSQKELLKAAQRGQDFSQGNADTVQYDCLEDLIKAEFNSLHNGKQH